MVPESVARAIVNAQRAQAQQIEHVAVLVETWADRGDGIPDVVPRAAAAAWDGVADAIKYHNEILLAYVDPASAPAAAPGS